MVIKIIYAQEFYMWEDAIFKSIGLDHGFTRFVIGIGTLVAFVIIAIKKRYSNRRKNLLD
ncbi:hypothetical protein [Desulforegula conservatrix]|uniref:hypothetical protein n=1 Tax=Desulforegula conservatrix TaxID=153026 RepID=UPI00048A2AA3|nr:hypothetical protein [Desulforegula conservatrix]